VTIAKEGMEEVAERYPEGRDLHMRFE